MFPCIARKCLTRFSERENVPKSLSIDLLRIDAGTQNRVSINEDVVEDYAELIAQSNGKWPFAPLDVFHDGSDYYVGDGFHRTLGAKRANRSSIPCEIHKGTARDARIFGMTANDRHGLRMSRADKRACVEWLLDNEPQMTQEEIGRKAGVSKRLVQFIAAERRSKKAQIAPFGGSRQGSTSAKGKPGSVANQNAPPSQTPASSAPTGEAADSSGEDERTDSPGTKPQEHDPRPPRNGKAGPGVSQDYGKCPNCASTKWTSDEFGVSCAKCHHPHGEPVGNTDEERISTQRQKTVKTAEALMRAFDDLNALLAKPEHVEAIASCKFLLKTARAWK